MTRSHLNYAVGAVLSIAAVWGLNHQVRPVFDPRYAPQEYATPNGTFSFQRNGASTEIGLMTTHVVTQDIERFGRSYPVRELLLRAAAPSEQTPGLEVYVDLSKVRANAGDFYALERAELPLLAAGRLGTRPSFVLLEGGRARPVITGSLMLTEVRQTETGAFRASGRVEMQVDNEHGVEMITGRLEGLISWDPATGA